jgi:hypothetical protein
MQVVRLRRRMTTKEQKQKQPEVLRVDAFAEDEKGYFA